MRTTEHKFERTFRNRLDFDVYRAVVRFFKDEGATVSENEHFRLKAVIGSYSKGDSAEGKEARMVVALKVEQDGADCRVSGRVRSGFAYTVLSKDADNAFTLGSHRLIDGLWKAIEKPPV